MANPSAVTTIVKEGEKAAEKAGKCAGLAAETPAHSETLKKLEDYKQKTFGGKSAGDLSPADLKDLDKVNDAINKLEKMILENTDKLKKSCPALPPAPKP